MLKIIKKPWGQEEILEVNDKYVVKRLTMNTGQRCSLQYHEYKKETILVLNGTLYVFLDGETLVLEVGETITITPGQKHRMFTFQENSIYLECSTPELDDVVRIEDDYERI